MAQLISLDFVKRALRIAEYDANGAVLMHEDDDVISAYIDTAQEAVLRYLKDNADEAWTDETAPRAVRHAILIGVQAMYDHDQMDLLSGLASSDPKNPIVGLLCMLRRPTLA